MVIGGLRTSGGGKAELAQIETVGGLAPESFKSRTPWRELVAIDPCERFDFSKSSDLTLRLIDLIAPIGKGTRGLIVSPPKAGKTTILEKLAHGIAAAAPETRIILLLVDERPEEVTHFRRSVPAEVLACTNDQSPRQQVDLAELTLAHIRTELECGRDVVLLVDSLTRMGRAFNVDGGSESRERGRERGGARTLSGGMQAGAMEIPRRFFGLARNVEGGGSVTILATALVDTGSRMDEVIFQEFKGTGNCEIILSRSLAEQRVFPAIDIQASGTRREERLFSPEDAHRIALIRRGLAGRSPREANEALMQQLRKFPTNREFLDTLPGK